MLQEIQTLADRGNYQQALQQLDTIDTEISGSLPGKLLRAHLLENLGQFEKALDILELLDISHTDDISNYIKYLSYKAGCYLRIGKFDETITYLTDQQKLLTSSEGIPDQEFKEFQTTTHRYLGIASWLTGKLDTAEQYFQTALSHSSADRKPYLYNHLGIVANEKGEQQASLDYYQQAYHGFKTLGHRKQISDVLVNMGITYMELGQYNKALELYHEALEYDQELGNQQNLAGNYGNIGGILISQGRIEKGMDYFQRSLTIWQEIGNPRDLTTSYVNLSSGLVILGEREQARKYLQLGLEENAKVGDPYVEIQLRSVLVSLAYTDEDKAGLKAQLDRMTEIAQQHQQPISNLHQSYAQGLYHRLENRREAQMKAMQAFARIIENDIVDFQIFKFAMFNTIELLLEEYQIYGNSSIIVEIREKLTLLLAAIQDQKSIPSLLEIYLLHFRLELADGTLESAESWLVKAEELLDTYALQGYADVLAYQRQFFTFYTKQSHLPDSRSRMEESAFGGTLKSILDRRLLEEQTSLEFPICFLIINQAGMSLYSRYYSHSLRHNINLVSSFISAIGAFMEDTFASEGKTQEIRQDDKTILVKSTVTTGSATSMQVMMMLAERIFN